MRIALGYVRVSTDEQAERGLGLEAQRQRIRAYCEMKGLHLTTIFEDPGLSGGHYDLSAVADYWPGVDATPGSGSGPGPMQLTEEEMVVLKTAGSITGTLVAGPLVVDIPHTEDAGALQGAGVPIVVVTQDFLNLVHQGAAALQGAISGQLSVSGNLTVK